MVLVLPSTPLECSMKWTVEIIIIINFLNIKRVVRISIPPFFCGGSSVYLSFDRKENKFQGCNCYKRIDILYSFYE